MRRIAILAVASACGLVACTSTGDAPPSSEASASSRTPDVVVFGDFAMQPIEDIVTDLDLRDRGMEVQYLAVANDMLGRASLEQAVEAGEPWGDVVTLDPDALAYANAEGLVGEVWPLTVEPVALCYRADLLESAGLPSGRDELAALLAENGGGWEQYFAVGATYRQATGGAWFAEAGQLWDAMVAQLPQGLTVGEREPRVEDDPELKARWDLLGGALTSGLSANESAWMWRDGEALADDSFATMPCSPATRAAASAYLEVAAPRAEVEWNVVDYFPGGAWSLGSTYVAVTASGAESAAAVGLATWLGGAEAQALFPAAGMGMPAASAAQQAWLDLEPDAFVRAAGAAEIDISRATSMTTHSPGPDDPAFNYEIVAPLLLGIHDGSITTDAAWQELVAATH